MQENRFSDAAYYFYTLAIEALKVMSSSYVLIFVALP